MRKLLWSVLPLAVLSCMGPKEDEPAAVELKAQASALNVDGFGLNPNNIDSLARADAVAARFEDLGARWVRIEMIRNIGDANFYSQVVDKFVSRGIQVLGLVSNQTGTIGASDPTTCGYYKNWFGDQLVDTWLPQADAYVQRMKDRVHYWEVWNEATAPNTHLCPGNYSYLLVEARLRWPDINIGTSFDAMGSSTAARDYVSSMKNTDKLNWYWNTYGDYPWQVLMTHAYPAGELPESFLPAQSNMLRGVQTKPIWFTESGWYGSNQAEQADMLNRAYNTALSGYADKYFWFALYDCTGEPFGLIADCANPDGTHRTAYGTYKSLTGGSGGGIPLNRWISIRAAANNMYVCADLSRMNPPELIANRSAVGAWEKFYVQDLGGGNVALYANANANYVCADVGRMNPPNLIANRTGIGQWETFQWIDLGNQNFALRAQANGNLVCADNGGASPLVANRTAIGQWETFHWDPQ